LYASYRYRYRYRYHKSQSQASEEVSLFFEREPFGSSWNRSC
jgi:hypothetical protein